MVVGSCHGIHRPFDYTQSISATRFTAAAFRHSKRSRRNLMSFIEPISPGQIMESFRLHLGLLLLAWLASPTAATAADASSDAAKDGSPHAATIDFAHEIQPIFARRCYKCHGPGEAEGGLRLDKRETAIAELESGGVAIKPGKSGESALLQRIMETDESLRMPLEDKPLSEKEIAAIRRWIDSGAEWGQHWAFTIPVRPKTPKPQDAAWVRNPIDAFVLAKLEAAGFNLTRLPTSSPSCGVRITTSSACRRRRRRSRPFSPTTRRMPTRRSSIGCSPRRTTASSGAGTGSTWSATPRPTATSATTPSRTPGGIATTSSASFNDDKPYDQFVREQLAGDELDQATPDIDHRHRLSTASASGTTSRADREQACLRRARRHRGRRPARCSSA